MNKRASATKYEQLGLNAGEYRKICDILDREPGDVELAVFSLMWSEHCGYKHSRAILKQLPTTADHVLQGPGENAGVIDIGENIAVAVKIESHNHPSAVEPFQGAATGVGGIIRDIFAMGARPVASLNSLRFGDPRHARQRYLLEGVVAGIGSYGNCIGVPTVGGEIYFEDSYEGNCLVNAMTIGVLPKERLIRAGARGGGNPVVLFGSTTGRDGIGGASVLASQEFDETLQEKRPSVQVGDPFTEKLLIEVCMELLEKNLLVALGDLGAAGITSSASEMASRGGAGIDIDVSKVPLREEGMTPAEIMISESQERMLAVIDPDNLDKVLAVSDKWDVPATVIGKITDTGLMRIFNGGEMVGCVPVKSLTDEAPVYEVEEKVPDYLESAGRFDLSEAELPGDLNAVLLKLLDSPNLCGRRWVWRQYDHQVQTNTVVPPGSDSAVLRLRGSKKGLALTVDGNGRYCYLDPYAGARIAVAEAARNIAAAGARPMAVTDCLNFGNPEKPGISWQFKQVVKGIADACEYFKIPVVSGNVSFYNESFGKAIYPTPTVGMIGLLDDVDRHCSASFKQTGDAAVLIDGSNMAEMTGLELLGGSEYLKVIHGKTAGRPPRLDLESEERSRELCRRAIEGDLLSSAHDCGDGGLATAIAECCMSGDTGAVIELGAGGKGIVALFAEFQSRFVVSLPPARLEELKSLAGEIGANYKIIGKVGGDRLIIDDKIDLSVGEMKTSWEKTLSELVDNK